MPATKSQTTASSAEPRTDTKGSYQPESGGTTHSEEDNWKHEPPYKIHDNGENFKALWHGRCHCGKVKYQLSREEPLDAKYCHCGTCQRLHGAPFQWAAIFHKTDINFTHGYQNLSWYDSSAKSLSHHLPCKVSCAYCRTPIMDEGRKMILLFPSLIDEISSERARKAFKVSCHIFYGSRVVDFHGDGVDKWEGLSKMSGKLDDEGHEVVEMWEDGKRVGKSKEYVL